MRMAIAGWSAASAASLTLIAPASAQSVTPALYWAGCAGALAVKTQRTDDKARQALLQPMARRALAQAKQASNPGRLTAEQLDGVAISSARNFIEELKQDPSRVAAFDQAAQVCMNELAKLPG